MGVSIPQPFDTAVSGTVGVSGIPDTFHIDVTSLPKIALGIDPVHVAVDSLPKIQLGIDPVTVNPIDLTVRLTEFPELRGHLPADFTVGLSVLGLDLLSVRVCGEAQVITEPYRPNPCERCGAERHSGAVHNGDQALSA